MKIKKLLSVLAGKREVVGVFISPRSTLELILIDIDTYNVINYKSVDFAYDITQRQITSMQLLESTIIGLLEDMNISNSTPVVLSLPTILMGHLTVPFDLESDEIKEAIVSDSETNYIFKKYDPVVSWYNITANEKAETQYILYSSFRKEEIAQIESVFKKIGSNLVAIDSSYVSALRGLATTGIITEDIEKGNIYSVLIVAQNSFVLIVLAGSKIIEIQETPLALKSFNQQDIYPTLTNYCLEGTKGQFLDHLIVVSESDEVSAEILISYIDIECKKTFVETNKYSKSPLFYGNINFEGDKPSVISLEAVGAALFGKSLIPVSFNFMLNAKAMAGFGGTEFKLFGKVIAISTPLINRVLISLTFITIFLYGLIFIGCSSWDKSLSLKIDEQNEKLRVITYERAKIEKENEAFKRSDVSQIVTTVYSDNEKIVQSYNAISSVIPQNLWINYVRLDKNLSSLIKGRSLNVDLIMQYYQDLLFSAKFNAFKVQSIKIYNPNEQANNAAMSAPQLSNVTAGGSSLSSLFQGGRFSSPSSSAPSLDMNQKMSVSDLDQKDKIYSFVFGDKVDSASPSGN